MKLHLSKFSEQNIFSGYGDGYIMVNQKRFEQNLVVLPDQIIENWPVRTIEQLETSHFDCLLPYQPEIIILGTGTSLRFPHHSLLGELIKSGIGIEVMDTQATCRTYNILVEEGRRVAAALLI